MKKAILAGLVLVAAAVAPAQVDPARVIAVVDGSEIRGAEYYRRMEYLPGVGTMVGNTFSQFYPGFMTLEQLINERLVLELAKSKGVLPSDAEVKDELTYRTQLDATYEDKFLASGRTHQDLIYDLTFELAQLNLLTAGITVTDLEVEQFYKENHPMFTIPQQFKLRVVAVGTPAEADAVDKEIAAGTTFTEVAKAHSVDASRVSGGELGTQPIDAFTDDVRKVLASTPAGQVTQWFTTSSGSNKFRFQVVEVTPQKLQELTPNVKRQARLRMRMDRGRVRNNVKKDLDDFRRKATIDIKDKGLAEAYKKYMDAYSKATGGG